MFYLAPLDITLTLPPFCNGGTATASASVDGGTGDYTYEWHTGEDTLSIENLVEGENYYFKVTDQNMCSKTETFAIVEPGTIMFSVLFCLLLLILIPMQSQFQLRTQMYFQNARQEQPALSQSHPLKVAMGDTLTAGQMEKKVLQSQQLNLETMKLLFVTRLAVSWNKQLL